MSGSQSRPNICFNEALLLLISADTDLSSHYISCQQSSEVELGLRETLHGSFPIPLRCCIVRPKDTRAGFIKDPDIDLSGCVALFGQIFKNLQGFGLVLIVKLLKGVSEFWLFDQVDSDGLMWVQRFGPCVDQPI